MFPTFTSIWPPTLQVMLFASSATNFSENIWVPFLFYQLQLCLLQTQMIHWTTSLHVRIKLGSSIDNFIMFTTRDTVCKHGTQSIHKIPSHNVHTSIDDIFKIKGEFQWLELENQMKGYPQQGEVFVLLLPYSFIAKTFLHLHITPILPITEGREEKQDKLPSEMQVQHRGGTMRNLPISQHFHSFQGQIKQIACYHKN